MSQAVPVTPTEPSRRSFEFLFLMALIFLPLYHGGVPVWSFSVSVVLAALSLGVLWFKKSRSGLADRTAVDSWIVLYLVLHVVSAVRTRIFFPAFSDSFKLAGVLVFFLGTLSFCGDRSKIKRFCTVLILMSACLSSLGLLQYLGAVSKSWWHEPRLLSSVYVNHNHFAGLLELLFPVSVGLALAERDAAKKSLFIFLCVLSGLAFVFTLSRGGYLSLAVGFLTMLFILRLRGVLRNTTWLVVAAVAVMVVVGILSFGTAPVEQRLETFDEIVGVKETSFRERLLMWRAALEIISGNFLFGTGPGTFGTVFLRHRPEGFTDRPVYAHSDVLQVASDCGLIAWGIVAGLLLTLLGSGIRTIRGEEGSRLKICVGSGCVGGLISLGVHSFFDFNFHIPANWVFASVLGALLLSLEGRRFYASAWARAAAASFKVGILILAVLGSGFLGLSDFFAWKASALARSGKSKEAVAWFDKSVGINPLNPEVYFWRSLQSLQLGLPQSADADLKKASILDPYDPYYDYNRFRIGISAGRQDVESIGRVVDSFVVKDPKDAKLRYLVGRDLLAMNHAKDAGLEKLAIENLARSVELNPRYAQPVYGILWNYYKAIGPLKSFHEKNPAGITGFLRFLQGNDLWVFHRPVFLESLGLDAERRYTVYSSNRWDSARAQNFALSDFSSVDGRQVYKNDFFYRNGEISREIRVRSGVFRVLLRARGGPARKAYPYLLVNLDGKTVDAVYINSPFEASFFSAIETTPGTHTLSFRYVNDAVDSKTNMDRNIWIRQIQIQEGQ